MSTRPSLHFERMWPCARRLITVEPQLGLVGDLGVIAPAGGSIPPTPWKARRARATFEG